MFYRKNHKTEDQEGSTRDVASSATYQDPRRMEPAFLYTQKTDFVTLCFYANLVENIEYLRVNVQWFGITSPSEDFWIYLPPVLKKVEVFNICIYSLDDNEVNIF